MIAREFLQVVVGELLDIHRLKVGGAEFEHLGPQQEVAPVARHVAELLEREQAAPGSGRGDARAARNVAQTQAPHARA